jgi:predicted Zn-dependent protease
MRTHGITGIIPAAFLCLALAGTLFPSPLCGQDRGSGLGREPDDAFSRMNRALEDEDLTAEDSYFIGRAAAAVILRSYLLYDSPDLTRYLNRICGALAANSPRPELYNGYHVAILNSREINAFATPGGHIFLTRELVELAGSEDALAAVIAHELAHIQLEHGAGIINKMRLTLDLTDTGRRAAGIAAREASVEERKVLFGNSVIELTNTLVKNGYSREQEFEADHYALALLALTGYQPGALIEMLRLLEQFPRQEGGIFATHPSSALRIRNAEGLLDRYRIDDTRPARRQRFITR